MTRIINPTIFATGGGGGGPALLGDELVIYSPTHDDDGNGTTTLTELLLSGDDGTLTNMDAATDWPADTDSGGVRALDFDGTNDHVAVPSLTLSSGTAWSISLWYKYQSGGGTFQTGVYGDDSSTKLNIKHGSRLLLLTNGNCYRYWLSSPTDIYDGDWHHIVFVHPNGTATNWLMYADGSLQTASTTLSGTDRDFVVTQLGGNTTDGQYIKGRIDNIRFYSSALTSGNVSTLHDSGSGRGY